MLTTFRYFNLRLVKRKWTWNVTYNFARKTNLNSLFFGIWVKVHFPLEGPLFDNSEIVVLFPFIFFKILTL